MARIVFYGSLADRVGRERTVRVAPAGERLREVVERGVDGDLALVELVSATNVRFAVNERIVPSKHIVNNADEIAVMPPFSGG